MTAPATRGRFLYSLPGVLAAVLGYALVHVTARLLASGNLGEDDPLDNLLIQSLAAGYSPVQPPLYDWLLWGLQQVLGVGVHAFQLLKYGLLVAIAGFLFLVARRVTGSPLWAFVAVEATSLTYQVFWRFHEGFTHRVGAIALAMATLWALFRLLDHGRRRDYAVFGVCVGLGLLTEPGYRWLLLALLGAALLQPAARRRLFVPAMLLVPAIAVLIVSPYAAWLAAEPARGAAFAASLLPSQADGGALWPALYSALISPVLVLAPYIFILPLVFPGLLRGLWRDTRIRPATGAHPDLAQFILHAVLLAWLGLLAGALFSRQADYPVHALLPTFLMAVVWLTEKVRASEPSPRRVRVFMGLTLALVVVAFLGRAANMYVLDPVCSKCRWGTPYAGLAAAMREGGFEGGTVIAVDSELGGNLRRFFPQSRFVVPAEGIVPPETAAGRAGPVALVWAGGEAVPASLKAALPAGAEPRPERLDVPWRHLWRAEGYRYSTWWWVVVERGG